jgi:hypothetical protein
LFLDAGFGHVVLLEVFATKTAPFFMNVTLVAKKVWFVAVTVLKAQIMRTAIWAVSIRRWDVLLFEGG